MRFVRVLALIALLLPSAYLALSFHDMPQMSKWHDGTVYFVTAKSLAAGDGYKIGSLPFEPYQTKYPPLYPVLLSLIWRLNPEFPSNLTLATFVSWLSVPMLLAAFGALCRRYGFSRPDIWILAFFLAWNGGTVLFGISLLSELWFTVLLLLCLICLIRATLSEQTLVWPIVAGVCAAAAYLTRTAGIMLLPAGAVWFLTERRPRSAVAFATPLLAAAIAWQLWTASHHAAPTDTVTVYYTSYFGYQMHNVNFESIGLVATRNLQELFNAIGSLFFPHMEPSWFIVAMRVSAGLFVVGGTARWLFAHRPARAYGIFAAASLSMQIVWHFPPNERFLFPLLPLFLMGVLHECRFAAALLRRHFDSRSLIERIGSRGLAIAGVAAMICCVVLNGTMIFRNLPEALAQYRIGEQVRAGAYDWIRANVPPNANVFADDDPLLYLHTGRRSTFLAIPPIHWYRGDSREPYIDAYSRFGEFARRHNLGYALLTHADFNDMGAEARGDIHRLLESRADFIPEYKGSGVTVYRVRRNDVRE